MDFDPIKEINKEKYLNLVALKCRYDLMSVNEENSAKGFEIGTHWIPNKPYPLLDEDLLYNTEFLKEEKTKIVWNRAQSFIKTTLKKDIIGKLDKMNQTKEMDRTIRSFKQKKYNKKMNVKFKTVKLNRSLKKNKKIKDDVNVIENKRITLVGYDKYKNKKKIKYDVKLKRAINERRGSIYLPDKQNKITTKTLDDFKLYQTIDSENSSTLHNTTQYSNRNRSEERSMFSSFRNSQRSSLLNLTNARISLNIKKKKEISIIDLIQNFDKKEKNNLRYHQSKMLFNKIVNKTFLPSLTFFNSNSLMKDNILIKRKSNEIHFQKHFRNKGN